jgi:RNA ligase (TIGR02306 family)
MKVATIEKILNVRPHPNADRMELATVNGWQVCIKKGEYKAGDLCIYVTTDTVLADCPQYEFLRSKKFHIHPIKLRKELSQGIIFPLSLLSEFGVTLDNILVGIDVADLIGAKHYEKPIPSNLQGTVTGMRPSYIRKTDEENFKSNPDALLELIGKPYYITVKVDGSSGTYYINDNEFGVCSRNLGLLRSDTNGYWQIAIKYDIEHHLRTYFGNQNIAIQGECYGPGIQGNKLGATEIDFKMFNLFDINRRAYLNEEDMEKFSVASNIPRVDVIERGVAFNRTLSELIEIANSLKYTNGNLAEGIVIRPQIETYSYVLKGRLSGKVINEKFELE